MSGLTLCGQNATGCEGTLLSALGLSYSRVCGQLRGYQLGFTNAFRPYYEQNFQLNDNYVNGISITYGNKHIWTYATALAFRHDSSSCPCNSDSTRQAPPYVGNDYYCETGNNVNVLPRSLYLGFFPNDPLWDGQQCDDVEAPCCIHPNMPWFIKTLGETTTEDIQLRLCIDGTTEFEETLINLIALYVY